MKPKVLIVDDEEDFGQLLEYNLAKEGCETLRASNGVQALKVARLENPDVILLDILLPDLDGLTICEILRSQPSTREIPIFIMSALSQDYLSTRSHKASFELYFTKPVNIRILGKTIRRATQQRHESLRSRLTEEEAQSATNYRSSRLD